MMKANRIFLLLAGMLISCLVNGQDSSSWTKYSIRWIDQSNLNAKKLFHDKSKASLSNNIADFYLYKNGELVKPTGKLRYDFFPAGCICFKFDDTLMLNSGLGAAVGVGVGIKIYQGKFSSTLHASSRNPPVYKMSKTDSEYLASFTAQPESQSLRLYRKPEFTPDEVIIGEYRATYRSFIQKNKNAKDETKKYNVRIIFKCRVTGMDSMKSVSQTGSR